MPTQLLTITFKNIGAELNNSTAIKQVQKMEKVITDYQTKLNDFKTRYSKANIDYSGFETVFNNFKNGIGTVNDLKLAFNQLENAAKMGVQSLKSQSSSLDPITQALNNMRDMPTMLKSLETNMAGLQNKAVLTGISVDELTSRFMKFKFAGTLAVCLFTSLVMSAANYQVEIGDCRYALDSSRAKLM